jgi:DNA-directed RNA polymerase specialized sigma24 family protein
LFRVKGVPYEFVDDLKDATYALACEKYPQFDPERSDFKTWVIWQARALVKNYTRNSHGPRNPLAWEKTESDYGEESSPFETRTDRTAYRDRLDLEIQVTDIVKKYLDNCGCFDKHTAVLQTLLLHNFDVSDRQIAEEIGISHTTVNTVRHDVLFELGLMLLQQGFGRLQ